MATKTWIGNGDNWDTSGDWSPSGTPAPGDTVSITSGNPAISGFAEEVASVTITGSNVGPTIDNGGSLHTTGDLSDGGSIQLGNMSTAGSVNALTVDGELSVTGNITSGFNGGVEVHNTISAGTLSVSSGALTRLIEIMDRSQASPDGRSQAPLKATRGTPLSYRPNSRRPPLPRFRKAPSRPS